MHVWDRHSRRLQYAAYALVALVTMGWAAAIGVGWAVAAASGAEFARDTLAVLTPGLMGLAMLAIAAVIVTLLAIIRRIRIRAHALGGALPPLLGRR